MLTVVTWKWKPPAGYRSKFGPETVNVLAAMVRRNYARPHRMVCVTDDPAGIDPRIQTIPLWNDFADLPNPSGPSNPSCYRRLRMFSAEAQQWFGPRFVSLDLDCVITGDLSPVWDRPEEFMAWGDTNRGTHYNGSMILMTAGARRQVWDDFDPVKSPAAAQRAGQFGSDQAWISHRLGPREKTWGEADGVYSYRLHVRGRSLPANAKAVFFHGHVDPWSSEPQRLAWVKQHYKGDRPARDVSAINLRQRVAVLTDGAVVKVTHLFNRRGEPTDDPAEALSYVAGQDGVGWFSGAVSDIEFQSTP